MNIKYFVQASGKLLAQQCLRIPENPDFTNYIMKFMENELKVNNLFSFQILLKSVLWGNLKYSH